jgi:CRP-like cAMP-binding protein
MSVETKYWHLRNHKLFSVMSNSQIEELCVIVNYKKATRGEIIYFSDDDVKRIYLLKKGTVKIVEADDNGNEIIKEILQPGDLFGEISLSSDVGSHEFAQAVSKEVFICSFNMQNFERVLEEHPGIALKFTKLIGFRFKKLRNSYANLVFKDVRSRLTTFLTDWAEKEGLKEGRKVTLNNYLTQQEMAGLVCSSRQTVTQLLNDLEKEGLISYNRKEIIIPDISKIQRT